MKKQILLLCMIAIGCSAEVTSSLTQPPIAAETAAAENKSVHTNKTRIISGAKIAGSLLAGGYLGFFLLTKAAPLIFFGKDKNNAKAGIKFRIDTEKSAKNESLNGLFYSGLLVYGIAELCGVIKRNVPVALGKN